jgi:hypothetical protein
MKIQRRALALALALGLGGLSAAQAQAPEEIKKIGRAHV